MVNRPGCLDHMNFFFASKLKYGVHSLDADIETLNCACISIPTYSVYLPYMTRKEKGKMEFTFTCDIESRLVGPVSLVG